MLKVNQRLTKDGTFRIILPENLDHIPENIAEVKTRDWLVPGEKTILFVEVKNCLNSPESFSFYCHIIKEFDQLREEQENEIKETNVIQIFNLTNIKTTKTKDGTIYFPTRLTVPLQFPKAMTIGIYCFGTHGEPLTQETFNILMPFTIYKTIDYTPQSMIISFKIKCAIPESCKETITLLSTSLKFDEKLIKEKQLSQHIAIISTNDIKTEVLDGDTISTAFALKPFNNVGGSALSYLPLMLQLLWKVNDNCYTSVFSFSTGRTKSDLVIVAPSAKVELLKSAKMPITVSNVKGKLPRDVTLHFGCGNIQPMTKSTTIHLTEGDEVKVIDFGFIPLVSGQHLIDISAEVEGQILKPIFPIYVDVYKDEALN